MPILVATLAVVVVVLAALCGYLAGRLHERRASRLPHWMVEEIEDTQAPLIRAYVHGLTEYQMLLDQLDAAIERMGKVRGRFNNPRD